MKKTGIISAVIYFGISLIAGISFFTGTLAGNYTLVERIGGSIWVFILLTIILMPVIIPRIKKKYP